MSRNWKYPHSINKLYFILGVYIIMLGICTSIHTYCTIMLECVSQVGLLQNIPFLAVLILGLTQEFCWVRRRVAFETIDYRDEVSERKVN